MLFRRQKKKIWAMIFQLQKRKKAGTKIYKLFATITGCPVSYGFA